VTNPLEQQNMPIHSNPQSLSFNPRYSIIKTRARKKFEADQVNALVARNKTSALNRYMAWCGRREEDVVGCEFFEDFDRNLGLWSDAMRREGKGPRTIADRCEMLVQWRAFIQTVCSADTLPDDFPAALKELMSRRGYSIRGLAEKIGGMACHTIGDWVRGTRRPTRHVVEQISRLECALEVPDGTLKRRLGFVIGRYGITHASTSRHVRTEFGQRMQRLGLDKTRTRYHGEPHPSIRVEWGQLITYKTADMRPHASKLDTWRVKPSKKFGRRLTWANRHGENAVPAADAAWSYIGRYIGWLNLPEADGGAGIPKERVVTLGWVANVGMVERFLAWVQQRSGGVVHAGLDKTLNYFCMLLRPETGWLWANDSAVYRFAPRDALISVDIESAPRPAVLDAWRTVCTAAHASLMAAAASLASSKRRGLARDPKEPIADLLAAERPVYELMRMLATLKENPPPSNRFKRRAVWLRDVLLLSWLIANPLRVSQFSTMTYRRDGTGNLYFSKGTWRYRAERLEFKNGHTRMEPGEVYDVSLPDYVGKAIEEYLRDGRPHLGRSADSDYVFLAEQRAVEGRSPEASSAWTSESISIRVKTVVRGLRPGLPAFGPHAFRHLVASDYLRRYPGAYEMVAHLLNDNLETVIKVYGSTSPQDGLSLHYRAAEEELRRAQGGPA
jgi:integrase